jgi:hypothetical protein
MKNELVPYCVGDCYFCGGVVTSESPAASITIYVGPFPPENFKNFNEGKHVVHEQCYNKYNVESDYDRAMKGVG